MLPLTKENANGQYAIVQPIRIFFAERCNYYLLLLNRVSCDSGASAFASINSQNGKYIIVCPILAIFMSAPHLHHSDKKLGSGVRVGCNIKEIKEIGSICYP